MIYKEVITDPFLRYQLMLEADDDAPASKNRKTITLKTKDRRKEVFSRRADKVLADDAPDQDSPEGETGEETTDEPVTDDDTTFASGETNEEADTPEEDDGEDTGDEPVTDNTSFSDMADDTNDDNGEDDESGEDTGEGDSDTLDEPVTDDTSFSDMADDATGDDNADGGDTDGENADDANNSNDSVEERTRKYKLYQKFQKLNKVLESQTDVINNLVSEDAEVNQKYKIIAKKIKELSQLLSEYQMFRFEQEAYIKSELFYQRVLVATDFTLAALKDIITKNKRNADKSDKH